MSNKCEGKVLFITGAGRGMGTDIVEQALAAGYRVVATGRNADKVTRAIGAAEDLLVAKLDVTQPLDAEAAVKAAVERFGSIDVLVSRIRRKIEPDPQDATMIKTVRSGGYMFTPSVEAVTATGN